MKRFIIVVFAVLMSQIAFAQGWQWQNSGVTVDLHDVAAADHNSAWAVGDSGALLHTGNGGVNWEGQCADSNLGFWRVFFVNGTCGWAPAVDGRDTTGVLLRTTDAGAHWTSRIDSHLVISSMWFSDVQSGWAIGIPLDSGDYGNQILRTTNGGDDWSLSYDVGPTEMSAIAFADTSHGWAVGDSGTIVHTADGGGSWTHQDCGSRQHIHGISAIDTSNVWVVGVSGDIFHSTNGGSTWTSQHIAGNLMDVAFVDANTGWVVGGGRILHTTDAGGQWTPEGPTEGYLTMLAFHDATSGWAVGDAGLIVHYSAVGATPDARDHSVPETVLLSICPNPFNLSTEIRYDLPKGGLISLRIFDLLGREVAILKDGFSEAGSYHVTFDGDKLATGIYFARLETGESLQTKKLLLLK